MANPATLNAGIETRAVRSVERIKRIDLALAKPGASDERKASLQAEKDRRLTELKSLKESLGSVLDDV